MDKLEATKAINEILRNLELQTGAIVSDVSLRRIDITSFESVQPEQIKSVVIDLAPLPGGSWQS